MGDGKVRWIFMLLVCISTISTAGLLTGCRHESGDGKAIYAKHCVSCHGPDAEGLRALYPPLRGSAYLDHRLADLPCLLAEGVRAAGGSGKARMKMPSFDHLNTGEMTELITYLQASWGRGTAPPSAGDVHSWLQECR